MVSKSVLNSQARDELEAYKLEVTAALAALQDEIDNAGGGVYRVKSLASVTIASGVTGTIWTSPALLDGELLNVFILSTTSIAPQSGITLTVDGNSVFSGQLAARGATLTGTDIFTVTRNFYSPNSSSNIGRLDEVKGLSMTLEKDAGNTTQAIVLAYEILEPI